MSILGVILAGGLSTRMNGHDKALIKLSGYPLIEHSINRLESQVDGLAININRDYNLYKKYNFDNALIYYSFLILWTFYGVFYEMEEGFRNVAYNILDLFSKCFVGIFFWAYFTKTFTL